MMIFYIKLIFCDNYQYLCFNFKSLFKNKRNIEIELMNEQKIH